MSPRVDFAIRSMYNLRDTPHALSLEGWNVPNVLRRIFATYTSTPAEFRGVRNSAPDIIGIGPSRQDPKTHCIFAERYYCLSAGLTTLATKKFANRESRITTARDVFLRIAADYHLQQGAHDDAARLYCASWMDPTSTSGGMTIDAGTFETYLDIPQFEASIVEGGWPLAHELGHTLAGRDELVTDFLSNQIEQHFGAKAGEADTRDAGDKVQDLMDELQADYFGAELLLRAFDGMTLDTDGVVGLFGTLSVAIWVLILMEDCKDLVRSIVETPRDNGAFDRLSKRRASTFGLRRSTLFQGVIADLQQSDASPEFRSSLEDLRALVFDIHHIGYTELWAGLYAAQRAMLHSDVIGLGPGTKNRLTNDFLGMASARSHMDWIFRVNTREFVNRAIASNSFRGQSMGLIERLDRMVPVDLPEVVHQRHQPDDIDVPVEEVEALRRNRQRN